jgi:hypothetical protein
MVRVLDESVISGRASQVQGMELKVEIIGNGRGLERYPLRYQNFKYARE